MAIDYEARRKGLEAEKAALDASAESATRLLEIEKELLEVSRDKKAAAGATVAELAAVTIELNAATVAVKNHNKAQADAKKSQDDFSNALGNTITTLTGVTTGSETLIGSFLKLRKGIKEGKVSAEDFAESMDSMFDSLNVGASIMAKVQLSTLAMAAAHDQALASFNKTTGAAGHYNKELLSLERSNRRLGISTAEMGESYSALMSGLSGFGVMAQSQREHLGETTARFGELGASTADVVGSIETMTRGFGMSTQAASGMVEESRQLAQALGRDFGSVVAELNQTLPKLASYGEDATDIFMDLERQAQRTGIEVGELIEIAGNYRTFDSAADAAGNLNAVLGTQLFSTMGLLEAQLEGPDQVIEYMSENLANSIGDWDSLTTFQKDAVANAANLSVEQVSNMMNQRNMSAEDRERITTQEEAMESARSMMKELKILFAEVAVSIQPIFNALKTVVGWISAFLQKLHDAGGLISQIGGLITLYLVGTFIKAAVKASIMNAMLSTQIPILGAIAQKWREIAMAKNLSQGGGAMHGPALPPGMQGGQMGGMGGGFRAGAGKFAKSPMGLGMLATGAGMLIGAGAEEGSGRAKAGSAISGAGSGAMTGAMIGSVIPGVGTAVGGALGGIYGGLKGLGAFADGTDSTPQGPAIVGERGPELLVPPPGSAVVNNSSMTALAKGGGGNNAAVVAAVQALGSKLDAVVSALNASGDTVLKIDGRELGRVINKHLGEPGYQKIDLRTA